MPPARTWPRLCLLVFATGALLAMVLGGSSLRAGDRDQTTFERIFGVPGVFDPAMVDKVKSLPPGEHLDVDRDGDGKADERWLIDTAARHTDRRRPLLLRIIDEDGDLMRDGPDLDSDLYLADWRADGSVDTVTDYQDNDGDGDVDEMGSYFGTYQQPWLDKDKVLVWYSRDAGDDNRLWYDTDWSYDQATCQYRSHFSGDEVFYQFSLSKNADRWLNVYEDPFAFYDPDADGCSEVVVRICAVGHEVENLRYSMDVDNDAYGRHTHDYDFSITALPQRGAVKTNDGICSAYRLRGIPTHGVLGWKAARTFAAAATWAKVCLTWDEMNANTEKDVQRDPHRRWEGIINHASPHFPQVGGPPCSRLNKRNEIAYEQAGPLHLYYDPTDHRLHLKGARLGWLDVDADLDGTVDARYTYVDEDGDGWFDRRRLDVDADGQIDFDWQMTGKGAREFNLDFAPLSAFYRAELAETLAASQALIDAAKAALGSRDTDRDPAEAFFLGKLSSWVPATRLGARMRESAAGARFYTDLIRDRLLLALQRKFGAHAEWDDVAAAYAAGDYLAAADTISRELVSSQHLSAAAPGNEGGQPAAGGHGRPAARPKDDRAFRSFGWRIPLLVSNTGHGQRNDWPVTLAVKDIRQAAAGFRPDRCAVVAPQRWVDWRQIPHQIDQIDRVSGEEISFLVDVPASESVVYYLYFAPTSFADTEFPARTGAAEDWVPPNIGWESNRCAYRAYWGQFDFFGKKTEQLIYHNIGSKSYHQEVEWGIDALHVGTTSGLGGLTLYDADRAWPVRNPAGNGNVIFTKRIVAQGPVRCAVEMAASNVIPDCAAVSVHMLCLIYAEHQETEIRANVKGGDGAVVLAPGIVKLPREQVFADTATGCFGTWGWQEDAIGQIGLGLVVAPDQVIGISDEPEERRVRCRPSADGRLRYWVIGDWRRGRQYPVAPAVGDWQRELRTLAGLLVDDVQVRTGRPERVQ